MCKLKNFGLDSITIKFKQSWTSVDQIWSWRSTLFKFYCIWIIYFKIKLLIKVNKYNFLNKVFAFFIYE